MKGLVRERLSYDLAVYYTTVEDEIINVVNNGGRTFFQNADTERNGVETSLRYEVFPGLDLAVAYTYADFTFDRSFATPAIEGNNLPGQP